MENEATARFSVLDRLIGEDRKGDGRSYDRWDDSVSALKQCLLRDLEDLFNTRQPSDADDIRDERLRESIYAYGLPDFASVSADSTAAESHMRSLIEKAIKLFEGRLSNVDVRVVGHLGDQLPRELKLVIRGDLRVEDERQLVQFDTVLDVANGRLDLSDHG